MEKRFNNNFDFCYPILEGDIRNFLKKIVEVDKKNKSLIELRFDYLLSNGLNIDEIVGIVNDVKSITKKKLIATIRTLSEGGKVDLSNDEYYDYIKELYLKSKVQYIDVEYKYYKMNKSYYDELFKIKKKKIIISMHIFDRVLLEYEYENLFKEMSKTNGDIVKFAIKVFSKEDLFSYMIAARKASLMLNKCKKECIFIAMGEIGKLSRLWPEFTNSKVVFLTAYSENANNLGQFDYENYVKFRKLLEKIDEN